MYAAIDTNGGGSMTREYILMNRDLPVLRFVCERNAFDEPEFMESEWLTELRPIGYGKLSDFLARRQAPKHREHIKELLERYGCDDLEGFLRVTHALSLNDTLWVKEADSNLCWDSVSLYQNEFDQLVSEAAFDGVISETDLSSTSPEFGTDGYYAKCWVDMALQERQQPACDRAGLRVLGFPACPVYLPERGAV